MLNNDFSQEALNVFKYINDVLIKEYPTNKITVDYFILSILENENSIAYQILSKSTLTNTLMSLKANMQEWFKSHKHEINTLRQDNKTDYDKIYDKCVEICNKLFTVEKITSGHILLSIMKLDNSIKIKFKNLGITYSQLLTNLNGLIPSNEKRQIIVTNNWEDTIQKGVTEELLIDMNDMAKNGKIDTVIGNEDTINDILAALAKRDRNNVIVVGGSGVGKTCTVSHIANLLVQGNVPEQFKNKKLMKMDFMTLVSGAALRGNFEARFNAIIADAIKKDGYIFFIDDLQSILSDKSKFGEISTESMMDMILMERNIMFVTTMDEKSYSTYILSNPSFKRRFHVVKMKEKNEEEIFSIINECKHKYERFHNVRYGEDIIRLSIRLVMEYVKSASLPDYVLDFIDEMGSHKRLEKKENEKITHIKNEIRLLRKRINNFESKTGLDYDTLIAEEIKLKSDLAMAEKETILTARPIEITEEDVREILSHKINVPVTELTVTEKDKLKTLDKKLKANIIGQDDAIDAVCKAVRRQRIGMSNRNRPIVLFFCGTTGTGKTYLAKNLAKEMFGSEKSMVRLDMSEYSDKMAVSKLYGASPGYIGYDKGGILTESVKKNNHCVLLLDEMEKANEDVHNVFLQLFDDGRLTDNTGTMVDFSNVIVIMTSNVGAKELSDKGNGIGFLKTDGNGITETISKAMKKKFSPEFINRIDNIVYFNKLSDKDILSIIKIEIEKLSKKVSDIGYEIGSTIKSDECLNFIHEKIKTQKDYGARPVIHVLQHEIEDKITDYIIDNQPIKGSILEAETLGINFF